MIKQEYFASPVYNEEKGEWVEKINNICEKYVQASIKKEEQNMKNRKTLGYTNDIGMSYHSDTLQVDPDLKFFHDYIAEKAKWILSDIGYDMSPYSLIYTDSWVQEFSKSGGGHHWFHTHANNHISGFYFLKASKMTSKPVFQDPRTAHVALKLKEKNSENLTNINDLVNYTCQPGSLVLFPSYLSHGFQVDHGLEDFRFIHINMRAIEKEVINSFKNPL